MSDKLKARKRRAVRLRKRARARGEVRLSVDRSLQHISAQVVSACGGKIIAAASTREATVRKQLNQLCGNATAAKEIGRLVAERAKAQGVEKVVFDRSGFKYHGRVKALAEGAREGGLDF